ncbi:hypothetical protein N7520_007942 [Penicillium odoratum]|uniref:uncharacterized protein n=1 Tax=Penicillium odoratum TaxID=1167516 RepID=UPI0025484526|nr:uncharacterized protein N7520_007942 [Penicillium odoratum]KAJ5760786.1 hypothetical protein N7520_007942 [Penicillium odoratum]
MPSPKPLRRSHSPSTYEKDRHHHRSRHSQSHSHRHRHRDDARSRSPHRADRHRSDRHHRRHDRDREHHDHKSKETPTQPVILPLQARQLSRRDLEAFQPMFAMYLDIQKGKFIEDMSEDEVKGRWKSFIHKWYYEVSFLYRIVRLLTRDRNRAELAEGWYDPATLQRARESMAERQPPVERERRSPDYARGGQNDIVESKASPNAEEDDDDEDDEYGPKLPHPNSSRDPTHSGPTIPRLQDLELKRESAAEDAIAEREQSWQQHRSDIRSHKAAVRNLEDEVAPRAEAGTRERQLEKRREAAAANREFANARGASPEAAPEEDLMGSGENDLAALKREKEKDHRKKNEREIRREEILRARLAEREERIQKYREKEQETMGWLHTLAKQRFG